MDINSQTDKKHSLSAEGTTRKKYGNYNVYGDDIGYHPTEDSAPFQETSMPVNESVTEIEPIDIEFSRCEKCGVAILDEDRLCIHCYRKKVTITVVLFIVAWIAIAVLTDVLFGEAYTFGSIFWFVLLPYLIRKDRFINKRRLYHSIPVTPEELTREIIRNPEFADKIKKEYGFDDNLKLNNEFLVTPVQKEIYKKLKKCKSNLLSEYPKYLYFVNGALPTDTIYINTTVTTDVKVPSTNATPISVGYGSDSQVSRNYKKSFVAVIIALVIVSTTSVATIVHQQTIIQEQKTSYAELEKSYDDISKTYSNLKNNYNELENEYDSILDEYKFYHYYAVCVDENDRYYHYYKCDRFDDSYFWIYNLEAAESKGFNPCPVCRSSFSYYSGGEGVD